MSDLIESVVLGIVVGVVLGISAAWRGTKSGSKRQAPAAIVPSPLHAGGDVVATSGALVPLSPPERTDSHSAADLAADLTGDVAGAQDAVPSEVVTWCPWCWIAASDLTMARGVVPAGLPLSCGAHLLHRDVLHLAGLNVAGMHQRVRRYIATVASRSLPPDALADE